MALFKNWRFNPFTQVTNDVSIVDEDHTVAFLDEINIFGIRLNESPKLNGIPSVAVVTDDTAATAFTEVPRTQAPSSGEFRTDYDEDTFFATGIVEFNSADDGQAVLVTYRGTGSVVKDKFITSQLTTLTSNVGIEGDLELAQDLFFTGTGNAKINEFSTDGTLAGNSDAVLVTQKAIKNFVNIDRPFRAFVVFTASGTFNVPADVTKIFSEVAGGGGGGAGGDANDGGAGGGAGERRTGLVAVTPLAAITVTIGAGGTAGAAGGSGGSGGNTSLGALFTSNGGGGAPFAAGRSSPGAGGTGGSGGTQIGGEPGGTGQSGVSTAIGGNGGGPIGGLPSISGAGAAGGIASGGAGGNGDGASGQVGGAGGAGFILIWY